jgi:peptidoglycan/xylan/chitin deacetylase (PgdA/CDA1 family)
MRNAATRVIATLSAGVMAAGWVFVAAPAAAAGCPAARSSVLYRTPATRAKTVSITIDDGPTAYTGQFLDVLRRAGVKATFYFIGENVRRDPALARRAAREGHVIGNHSWDHPNMTTLGRAAQARQMDRTSAEIRKATGVTPCHFRGPGGATDHATLALARARRMTIAHWTYSTQDWRQADRLSSAWQRRIVSLGTGSDRHPIVLMHDGGPMNHRANSVAALDNLVRWYRDRGYVFTDPAGRPLSGSFPASIPVTPSIATRPSDFAPPRRAAITLRGLAYAIAPGTRLTAEAYHRGRGWVRVGSTAVRADNTFAVTVAATTTQFRVNAPNRTGNVVTLHGLR